MLKVDIYCFSGTGNTLIITEKIRETLEEKGCQVNIYPLAKCDPKKVDLKNTLGLAFPVAVFSTYPLVWDFVTGLPNTQGTPLFMVDTLAGASGGMVGPLKKIIKKKGYKPLGALEIIMPSNFLAVQEEAECKEIRAKGEERAKQYAMELLEEKAKWDDGSFLSDLICLASRFCTWIWKLRLNQYLFHPVINREKCIKCGLCTRLCPTMNVEMKDYPQLLHRCQYCMRCMSYCPAQAISLIRKEKFYRGVPVKEMESFISSAPEIRMPLL